MSGTAATGAAIAGGAVSALCASGASATTTTGSDGKYSLDLAPSAFPCVVRVSYGAASRLHSYVAGAGIANVTPITELLLANLTGGTAADAFDKFDASKLKALTPAQVAAAIAAVKAYLAGLGVAVTDFPTDPIGTALVAKTAAVAGDRFDAVLDDLAARLKAGSKTLADAVADVSKGATAGGAGCTGAVATFFAMAKGSFTVTASTFSNAGLPGASPASVAGFANGGTSTLVVADNCTVSIGTLTMAYKDGSYQEFGSGGSTTYGLDLTGTGVKDPHFEMFPVNKHAVSLFDPAIPANGVSFQD